MPRTERWTLIHGLFVALAVVGLSACELLGSPSHVSAGELYAPGEARYDAYFASVHQQQIAASKWSEDKKAARKALADSLNLAPNSSDGTITQATRDHLHAGTLRLEVSGNEAHVVPVNESKLESASHDLLAAVEQTARLEMDRAKRLRDLPPKLDELAKAGHDLDEHVAEDFGKAGGQKPFEVRQEMRASFDVLASLAGKAEDEAKAAESFVSELQTAVATGSEVPTLTRSSAPKIEKPDKPDKPDKPARHAPPPRHEETPSKPPAVAHSEAPPAPKPPPPKPPESAEVFQP